MTRHLWAGFLTVTAFLLWGIEDAHACPDMIRHGYVNCATCHVSPTGGGTLSEYGRALSLEALSTWGNEGESDFLYGVVKPPSWLLLGGDFRMLQVYEDT